jgi:hypothetical protein
MFFIPQLLPRGHPRDAQVEGQLRGNASLEKNEVSKQLIS